MVPTDNPVIKCGALGMIDKDAEGRFMIFTSSFEVSKDDYLKFCGFAVKRAIQPKSQFSGFIINFLVWFFIAVFFASIFQSSTSNISNINWGSAFIGALPFCLFLGYLMRINYKVKKFSMPHSNGIILGSKTIELSSEGVVEYSDVSKCQYLWSCVEDVAEDSGNFYIFLDKMYAVIIPHSAFTSHESVEQFKSCLNEYLEKRT